MFKILACFVVDAPDLTLAEEYLSLVIEAEREANPTIKQFDITVIRSLSEGEEAAWKCSS